jgi:predicted DNA-binding protein with PD1-like motif
MNTITSEGPYQVVTIGLGPEEKLLESIREAIVKHDIKNGAVVSGVGTLKHCHLHYVDTTGFPPVNKFYVINEPLEIGSISGLIVDYEPHLHITVGCREDKAWNGHLENESVVLYLAEICIFKMNHHGMKREIDPKNGLALLGSG